MREDHSARLHGSDQATHNASRPKELGRKARFYDIKLQTSPVSPLANRPTLLRIVVTDSAVSNPIREFDLVHGRRMHLVVVSEDLAFFDHVHPELRTVSSSSPSRFQKPVRTGSGPRRSRKAASGHWSRSACGLRAGGSISQSLSSRIGKRRRP